jgi:hypothetical protein
MKEPVWYRLDTPRMIHPGWITTVRGKNDVVVSEDGKIILNGLELFSEDYHFKPGTHIIVMLSNWFYATDKNAFIEYENYKKLIDAELQERKRIEKERRMEEDRAFNKSLNIGAAWYPAIKEVLSGLSETRGDGASRRTVTHIKLSEPLNAKRLNRKAGDFLCSQVTARGGGNWSGTGGREDDDCRVTCKRCLEIAGRLIRRRG